MDSESIDVKANSSSSDESSAGDSQHRSDVMGDSSGSTPSNDSTDASARSTSMADFVKQSLGQKKDNEGEDDTSTVEEDEADANKEKKSDSDDELDKEKKDGEKVDDKKEDVEDEEKGDEDEKNDEEKNPVPYERFQKVVGERQDLEKRFKEVEPKAQHFDQISRFCHENGIASEDFTKALEVQALLSQGDAEGALKRLLPIVEELQGMTGNKLPSDLQKKVDDAVIDLDTAKELAKLRGANKFGKANGEQMQRRQAEHRQREFQQQCASDAAAWEQSKLTTDPEYKAKAKDSDANGKWEMVRDNYLAKLNAVNSRGESLNPVRSSKDMVSLMERAYKEVDATWKNLNKGRRNSTRKSLPSNGSSTTSGSKTIEGASTMAEAIKISLARR